MGAAASGSAEALPHVCDKQLPGLRPKPLWTRGRNRLETGVYWGKFRVMGNCCVQALEDTTIAGSTLNSLLARALRLSRCCKPELPCSEIPASAAAGWKGIIIFCWAGKSPLWQQQCLRDHYLIHSVVLEFLPLSNVFREDRQVIQRAELIFRFSLSLK